MAAFSETRGVVGRSGRAEAVGAPAGAAAAGDARVWAAGAAAEGDGDAAGARAVEGAGAPPAQAARSTVARSRTLRRPVRACMRPPGASIERRPTRVPFRPRGRWATALP